MKRFLLLTVVTLLFAPLHAKDGDQITLQSGTANVIWTLNSAYFETDWSEAKVEGVSWDQWLESKGPDYVRDWPSDKRKIEEYFLKRFNKKTSKKNGLSLQTSNPNDSYSFVIHLLDVDMGSIGGGVVASAFLGSFAKKSGGVNFKSGFVDIVEVSTGKVVCRLAFKDVRGDSGLNMSAQLILVLEDLHDEIIGFADRFKGQSRPELYVAAGGVVPQEPTNVVASPQVQATGSVAPQASTVTSQQQVAVKLKNGATIKGVLKSFDPLDKIVLLIAGQETTIPMEKVENVETTQALVSQTTATTVNRTPSPQTIQNSKPSASTTLGSKKLMVTETVNYPERITINIGNTPIELLLVKGGRMNMGFDGDHSIAMKSEPIHEVEVSSFYISSKPLSQQALMEMGKMKKDDEGFAIVEKYKDVTTIVDAIVKATGKPYRIPTEAEWEYAASCDLQNQLFGDVANNKKIAYDWCSDYYDEFRTGSVEVDPTGPISGKDHVVRAYNNKYGKYNRNNTLSVGRYTLGYIRLVIKAKDADIK